MNAITKDFHVLSTGLGPVVFHAPSYRLFQVDEEMAEQIAKAGAGLNEKGAAELQRKLLGESSNAFSLKASLLGERKDIDNFYLFVSQECNLACSYCYGDGGEYRKGKMDMDEATARNFVEKFLTGDSPSYLINFFGGEPFLNFSLMRTVVALAKQRARERGFQVAFKVTTNGTVWTERIKQFVDAEIDSLTVSLDGPKDINDGQRLPLGGFSPYEKTMATLEDLRKIKSKAFTIRTILTKRGVRHLDEIYRHNSGLTASGGLGLTVVDVPPESALALSDEDHQTLIDHLIKKNSESLEALATGKAPQFNEFTYQLCELLLFRKYRPNPCNAGSTTLAIAADGDIYPCHRFVGYEQFRVGNVNDAQPLGEEYGRLTHAFKETSVDANPQCSQCWARYLCGGNCYVISWLREGDLFKPPTRHCQLIQSVYGRLLAEFGEVMADPVKKDRFMANVKNFYEAAAEAA